MNSGVVLKSERELEAMREAGRVNALALSAAAAIVRPGITTSKIDEAAVAVLREHMAQAAFLGVPGPFPYPATTTVCVNDELVHAIPGKRRLKEGDIVSIDCGSIVDGFVGDSAITIPVGQVSSKAEHLMEVTLDALVIGIEQMIEGNRTGDISAAIQSHVEANGFNVVREYTGHGVGRHMHEDPQVPNYGSPGKGIRLRPGMTIALEPMVLAGSPETRTLPDGWAVASADGHLTAHFEHTVAVTSDGPRVLTALDTPPEGIRYNRYFVNRPASEKVRP
ncbi:MAG: type I methionyl aminopeptidase [Chloroflexi bacterium]|nr:type I methionyl aminopeptidase [Chloroflexota bacterium]